jgi:hypothetical protein
MTKLHSIFVVFLLSLACAHAQMTIISSAPKDPDIKPEQRTANIVHYEKMRFTARQSIRVLVLALQNTDGSSKVRVNEAINNEEDIVDWANWCILALRDKTADAKTCVFQPEPK